MKVNGWDGSYLFGREVLSLFLTYWRAGSQVIHRILKVLTVLRWDSSWKTCRWCGWASIRFRPDGGWSSTTLPFRALTNSGWFLLRFLSTMNHNECYYFRLKSRSKLLVASTHFHRFHLDKAFIFIAEFTLLMLSTENYCVFSRKLYETVNLWRSVTAISSSIHLTMWFTKPSWVAHHG